MSATWSIGYWVLPEARRRGLALGAARALAGHALAHGRARRILLETGRTTRPRRRSRWRSAAACSDAAARSTASGAEHDQLVYEISGVIARYVPGRTEFPQCR